jgi:hypothetical protein
MGELSAAQRKKLKPKQFGLPEKAKTKEGRAESGSYPMPDAAHARNAKARATQQEKKGNLSHAQAEKIRSKADKKLGNK